MRGKRRGHFVVFEGADGSGTTTQARLVAAHLRTTGAAVVVTCEPSTGKIGALLRHILATTRVGARGGPSAAEVALLFAADRLDHVRREIKPALATGAWVLSDRYVLSSLVYQGCELPDGWVCALNQFAALPDLTLLLDVPAVIARGRRQSRGGGRERFDDAAFQRRVIERYRNFARTAPHLQVIDGTRPPSDVTDAILRAFERRRWIGS